MTPVTPLCIRVEDLDSGDVEAYAFHRSPVRVGRGALNDLRLERPYVSVWHGLIQFDDGIRFVDLGSTNGSFVDGARLARNAPATVGGKTDLTIGRLRLHLSRGAPEGRTAPAEPVTSFAQKVAEGVAAAEAGAMKPSLGPSPRPVAPAPSPEPAPAPRAAAAPAPPARAAGTSPDPAVQNALEVASWQLGILHDACQQASDEFAMALDQALAGLGEDQRASARAVAAARYPHALGSTSAAAPPPVAPVPPAPTTPPERAPAALEPATAAPGLAPAPPPPTPSHAGLHDDALRLVRAFAEAYLPARAAPTTPAALEQFLGALAEALETAARGYLELRGGYDQFGLEMGIRVPKDEGALARISDARQLVGWLIQPGGEISRPRQLASAFADLMIHQVALLNGVQSGARALLDELSPVALEDSAKRGSRLGLKPLREAGLWRAFVERHGELAEDSAVTAVLFGSAFARAYAAVTGRRAPGDPAPAPAPIDAPQGR